MRRGSGVLLHITCLPSPFGAGDIGTWAYKFADFLAEAKQRYWQVLPLNPTDMAYGNCPYTSTSAFAGNTLLVSPELMVCGGLLMQGEVERLASFPRDRCDYATVISQKENLFNLAYGRFRKERNTHYERFCVENVHWLGDFALFVTLKKHFHGKMLSAWPEEIRDRRPESLQQARNALREEIEREKFLQYLFFKQWSRLKNYCNQKGILLIGDLPIYVSHDSVEVWQHPEMFMLDGEKKPLAVAGVPPDYFSLTGQLWGNPLYRWDRLKETGYKWWMQRVSHNLNLFDMLRIDHFRGFVAHWEVPAGARTAVKGKWVRVDADDFFERLCNCFPSTSFIAEDLGVITPDVRKVMHHFGFPGMRVLLFAFGEETAHHPYAPHNYQRECVVYTGTHDNNTVKGWFENEATPEEKERVFRYLGREVRGDSISWEFIRLIMMSVADIAIVPMQDILGLGEEARMNRPGTLEGNWQWRALPEHLSPLLVHKLLEVTETYGRA